MEPPSYDVAIKLPTYEEAQQEKMIAEQQHRYPHSVDPRCAPTSSGSYNFMSPFSHPVGAESQFDSNTAELALGTDVYFFASFLSKLAKVILTILQEKNCLYFLTSVVVVKSSKTFTTFIYICTDK